MFEGAVALDPDFALPYAGIANVCAQYHYHYEREVKWMERARAAATRAAELRPDLPEVQVAQAWILYAEKHYDDAVRRAREAIGRKRDCEGGYYILGRALFASGRYQDIASVVDAAVEACGDDYNVYVPIMNALSALGKDESARNVRQRRVTALENHLKQVPDDARARAHLAGDYVVLGRQEDAVREVQFAVALRPNDGNLLYNVACVYCNMNRKPEAIDALRRAWDAGLRDADWARRDPDLAMLHGDPEFERLFPETAPGS
jgi:tetratricopeptide (TPR) repeat protein